MLVLNRRASEKIYIGDDIVITVLRLQGNQVKLGFDCPKNIKILRNELKEQEELGITKEYMESIDKEIDEQMSEDE